MDMSKYNKENDRIAFVLIVIDKFSKFLWMQPLKDKKSIASLQLLKMLFEKAVVLPEIAQIKDKSSDSGLIMLY